MVKFFNDIKMFLNTISIQHYELDESFVFATKRIIIFPIPLSNPFLQIPIEVQKLGYDIIFLYQDRWMLNRDVLCQRIKSRLGIFNSVFARKCKVIVPEIKKIVEFLNLNHPYGYVKGKYNYALEFNGQIVAVATFSESRPLPRRIDDPYLDVPKEHHSKFNIQFVDSYEWMRYATLPNIRVQGGMGKLISFFIKEIEQLKPKSFIEVMSYSDNEWSTGDGYLKLGFKYCSYREPIDYYVDKINYHRLSLTQLRRVKNLNANDYIKIKNRGSNKFLYHKKGCLD